MDQILAKWHSLSPSGQAAALVVLGVVLSGILGVLAWGVRGLMGVFSRWRDRKQEKFYGRILDELYRIPPEIRTTTGSYGKTAEQIAATLNEPLANVEKALRELEKGKRAYRLQNFWHPSSPRQP